MNKITSLVPVFRIYNLLDSFQNISERGKRRVGDKREVIDLKGEPHSNYDINTNWLIL